MTKFSFYRDTKYTIWDREYFTIKAETKEQARALAIDACKTDDLPEEDYFIEGLEETMEKMSLVDNDGQATETLHENEDDGNEIWTNQINE